MSKKPPFKGYFEYQFSDSISKLYQNTDILKTLLSREADENGKIDFPAFLTKGLTGTDIEIFKKDFKIKFNYHTLNSIEPKSFHFENLNTQVSFKVKSDIVEVLDIENKVVKFKDSEGTKIFELTDNIDIH